MNAMKKIGYTTLLGMLMMGMTGGTAWSQAVTVASIDRTATSAAFRFEGGITSVVFVVRKSSEEGFTSDATGQLALEGDPDKVTVDRAMNPEVTTTVEGLEPFTSYKLYFSASSDPEEQEFTTLLRDPDVESRLVALDTRLTALDTRLTTLEAHGHTDLSASTHGHTDLSENTHGHTDLSASTHGHTDLSENTHTHTAVPTHSHADLAASDHAHADPTAPTLITSYRSATSRLVFIPNPAHDTFTIQGIESYDRIEVYDIQGRVVHTQQDGLSIDLARHPRGVYHVKVHTRNAVHEQRIIKE